MADNMLITKTKLVIPQVELKTLKKNNNLMARLLWAYDKADKRTVDMQYLSVLWWNNEQKLAYNKVSDLVTVLENVKILEKQYSHKQKEYIINKELILDFLNGDYE